MLIQKNFIIHLLYLQFQCECMCFDAEPFNSQIYTIVFIFYFMSKPENVFDVIVSLISFFEILACLETGYAIK